MAAACVSLLLGHPGLKVTPGVGLDADLGEGTKHKGQSVVFFSPQKEVWGQKSCFVTGYLTKQGYRGQGQASACRAKAERKTGRSALLPVYEQA